MSGFEALLTMPFVRHLGLILHVEADAVVLEMPYSDHLVGNPRLPALHGGVMAALLECAAFAEVMRTQHLTRPPKVLDHTVDFLRPGRALSSFARARIVKPGRRVMNVEAQMWQDERTKPVALLHGHFLPR